MAEPHRHCWGSSMQKIEALAELSVARACGFAALGCSTSMIGFSGEPILAFKFGGYFALITCAVLLLKAHYAARRPYKATEVWLLLPKAERPEAATAQKIISGVLRDVFLRFAFYSAGLAAAFLFIAIIFSLRTGALQQ